MADPAFWPTTTVQERWTLQDIVDYVNDLLGGQGITGTDLNLLKLDVNAELAEVRERMPHAYKGYGERRTTLTWDPASTTDRIELPADFEEFLSGGRAYIMEDANGTGKHPIEVISRQEELNDLDDGENLRYDNREYPVLVVYGLSHHTSDNDTRLMELFPRPEETVYIDLPYIGRISKVDNLTDELEAPVTLHRCVCYGTAVSHLDRKGFGERARPFAAKRNAILEMLSGKSNETHRVSRFRSAEEARFDQITTYPR